MKKDTSPLDGVIGFVFLLTVFLVPLFFLPITSDAFEFPKMMLIFAAVALCLLLWVVKIIVQREVRITISPLALPLLLFMLTQIVSLLIVSPNKIQPFLAPGSIGTIIILFVWFFLVANSSRELPRLAHHVRLALGTSAAILSLVTLANVSGFFTRMQLPDIFKQATFSPAGSPLIVLTITITALAMIAGPIFMDLLADVGMEDKKEKDTGSNLGDMLAQEAHEKNTQTEHGVAETSKAESLLLMVIGFFLLIGVSGCVYQLVTSAKPLLLPYWAGWEVSIDGLKQIKSAFFGVGPANYVALFTKAKPIALNSTPLWNLRFGTSSNYYLQLMSETGLLSIAAFSLFVLQVIRASIRHMGDGKSEISWLIYGIFAILAIQLFLPTNTPLLFLLFTLSGLLGSKLHESFVFSEKSKILPWIVAVCTIVLLLPTVYFAGRAYAAEIAFQDSIDATRKNEADRAYNKTVEAINLNPYIDLYHVGFSQLGLAIATNMSRQPNITDANRQTISGLIQQAISEGKSAVADNPTKAGNWENLALIYRNIINVAQGANTWTVQVFQQAVSLDPANPMLRLELGGVFYSLGQLDGAIEQFKIAIAIKGDFANAYYNLANAYKERGQYDLALDALHQTIQYVPADSPDFDVARKELENVEKLAPSASASAKVAPSLLTRPSSPAANMKPPLSLPTEAAPPANQPNNAGDSPKGEKPHPSESPSPTILR